VRVLGWPCAATHSCALFSHTNPTRARRRCQSSLWRLRRVAGLPLHISTDMEHGSHNVSRWMTWLPISLKNAAKCDNWYQLQNHSITESLNAKGAREKPFTGDPRACRIAQCRTKTIRTPQKRFTAPLVWAVN
jgi:hypothetical protein